jgi:LmbE family N-acetylglucosaminyl deacetylase
MIVPHISENQWLKELDWLPSWEPPLSPMLVIAPHPDDETLGAGGLIAYQRSRGVDCRILAVTDGENAYCDLKGLGVTRRREQEDALAELNVPAKNLIRLGLNDSGVAAQQSRLEDALSDLASRDTHIVAPWRHDFHPDHEVCGRVAEEVARLRGLALTSYFFWTWHFAEPGALDELPLRALPLAEPWREAKMRALSCHHSQLNAPETYEPILPDLLLAPAYRSFETFSVS